MRDTLYKVWPFKGVLAAELFSFSYILLADRAVISETLEMNERTNEKNTKISKRELITLSEH